MSHEDFTQRHAETISKLKLALIVVCLIAIPVSFWLNHQDLGSVNNRITNIESPCQRFGSESKVCQEAFETAVKSISHRIACYIDRKAGKPFKPTCRGVKLRIEQAKPAHAAPHNAAGHQTQTEAQAAPDYGIGNGGDADQPPSQGTQQPAPGNGGAGNHGGSGGNGGQPSNPTPTSPTASPSPSPSTPSTSSSSDSSSSSDAPAETPAVQSPPPPPPAEPSQPIAEGVGQVVEGAGAAVTETVESVNGVLCGTTGALGLPCR